MRERLRELSVSRSRFGGAVLLLGTVLALALGGFGAASASASPLSVPTGTVAATTGWVRLAHLSPDTTAVDVQLTALAGGSVAKSLQDIGYGAVSPYMALPAGTYVVSMVPTGASFANPVIQASFSVVAGEPMTVAAYGKNAELATAIFRDDLTAPADGQSRVRVVQASTIVPSVNVATSTGTAIANDAKEGTATDYASVPAGKWNLALTSGSINSTADVDLAAGSVSTLFVLDNATGGLALKAVLDSASVGDLPTGGIQTGGGGTAVQHVNTALQHVSAAVQQSSAAEDRLRRTIDEVTGWVFLAAGVVGVLLLRRRSADGKADAEGRSEDARRSADRAAGRSAERERSTGAVRYRSDRRSTTRIR